jgi:hypothetical protein
MYVVLVSDGVTRRASFNGRPLNDRRTLGTWSVAGMFAAVDRDLHQQQAADEGRSTSLLLRGAFHPQYGFPERYQRIEWGSSLEISWHVTRFRPLTPASSSQDSATPSD